MSWEDLPTKFEVCLLCGGIVKGDKCNCDSSCEDHEKCVAIVRNNVENKDVVTITGELCLECELLQRTQKAA